MHFMIVFADSTSIKNNVVNNMSNSQKGSQ